MTSMVQTCRHITKTLKNKGFSCNHLPFSGPNGCNSGCKRLDRGYNEVVAQQPPEVRSVPIDDVMTWVHEQRRWTKRYRGRRFYVSARQLGCPETKEASIKAANEWWRNKQAELDLAYRADKPAPRTPAPLDDLLTALGISLPQENEGMLTKQARLSQLLGVFKSVLIDGQPWPEQVAEQLPHARVNQLETSVKGIRGESTAPPERTIQAQADSWLRTLEDQVAAKGLTDARLRNVRTMLAHFTKFLGEKADISTISNDTLEGFHRFCLSKITARANDPAKKAGWSVAYAKETFKGVARVWVGWLADRLEDFPRPSLLGSRKAFKFPPSHQPIIVWTREEVHHVLRESPEKFRLILLLMLNTGATQIDVSELCADAVDWKAGRVTRKRHKHMKREHAPTVCYPLWKSTFALLQKYRSDDPEHVLLTKQGTPYLHGTTDGIAKNFGILQKKLGFKKTLKHLRKTAASLIEDHPVYGRLTDLFLANTPNKVKDRHYALPAQNTIDEAVAWLGEQLGIADPESFPSTPAE
jgi:integrase